MVLLSVAQSEDKWPVLVTGRFSGESTAADEEALEESLRREILALMKTGVSAELSGRPAAALASYATFYGLYQSASVQRVSLMHPSLLASLEDEEFDKALSENFWTSAITSSESPSTCTRRATPRPLSCVPM